MHARPRGALRWAPAAVLLLLTGGCASLAGPGSEPTSTAGTATTTPTSPRSTSTPAPGAVPADLTIALDETGEGAVTRYSLACDPPGGDHPDPVAACQALAEAGGAEAMAAPPRDQVCTEQYGGPQTASVEGTVEGQPVRATFARTNGCQISRWDALAPLLGSTGEV